MSKLYCDNGENIIILKSSQTRITYIYASSVGYSNFYVSYYKLFSYS